MGVASLLFWLLLRRLNLVQSARWRIAVVTVFHLGYGISFAYRCSRPDTLGLVLTIALGLLFTCKRCRLRNFSLFAVATTLPWVSLNGGLYAGLACFCCWLVLRQPKFLEATVVWIGLIVGVLSLGLFLSANGALQSFIAGASHVMGKHYAVAGQVNILTRLWHVFDATWSNYLLEYSTAVLLVGTLLLLLLRWRDLRSGGNWRVISCSALLLFSTPLLFNFVGHYAFYYSYTIFTPALILFASVALSASSLQGKPLAKKLITSVTVLTLTGAALVGLPMRLVATSYFTNVTPRSDIRQRVDSCISDTEVVYTDDTAFFEVKPFAKVVYARWSSMDFIETRVAGRRLTQAEKDSVTKLVIRADKADFFTNYFGGNWEAVTEPFGDTTDWDRVNHFPLIHSKLKSYLDQPQTWRYQLQIFKRKAQPTIKESVQPPEDLP